MLSEEAGGGHALEQLNLGGNCIGAEGAAAIGDFLGISKVQYLLKVDDDRTYHS
jgi:hypothetical protein